MLDLVRLSPRRFFPPGGEALYRQVALLTELRPGVELLDVACGRGVALEYFVREWGVHGTGVDPDPDLLARGEAHMKGADLAAEVSFQEASPDNLPFRDQTFDVVVGEMGLGAGVDPGKAVREMIRVTRQGGHVALIQLTWTGALEEGRKEALAEHLGARPLMVVELRRILLEAGVRALHAEDWTDEGGGPRGTGRQPFPDFAELFSFTEKMGILRRAWRRWGWKGVRSVFQREAEIHRLLTRERSLGLNLLLGVKGTPSSGGRKPESGGEALGMETDLPPEDRDGDLQASGLPLFGGGEGRGSS